MSKLDMRNYLQSIYKVKVAKVNTRIQQGATHITQLQELNQHFVWKQCLVQDSRNKESFESQSKLFITICKVSWVLVNSDHLTFTLLHFNTLYCIYIFCYITNYLPSKLNYEWYPKSILLFSLSFPIARNYTCTSTLLSECFVLLYSTYRAYNMESPYTCRGIARLWSSCRATPRGCRDMLHREIFKLRLAQMSSPTLSGHV